MKEMKVFVKKMVVGNGDETTSEEKRSGESEANGVRDRENENEKLK